ncbi:MULTISPECIES: 16S rRNA (guanine(527)-N(7))-methyltransferase RsmG [Fictibacillus]|jgi:16S rRNA (guanine527-N7)-methyltransferase|uniref:16S rRNA (guanine(527)-N(7))-methyltransferase RsmG n=1 Tax=Fictibacillus TaxID=1329200 RepID=UPI0010291281|nr:MULTISPECIES: 16S rRNA (guanine(527)-N(7))-methyltransferase RsmG [Fictibacillus]RZT20970.1 16S rRNA m(7)G-527 methyltransferase [Fictibacillus sp. BK138]
MNIEMFQTSLKEKGIELSEKQLSQFENYFHLLVEWNEKMNLTGITEKEEVYLKHFYDSVTAAFYFNFNQDITVCDVGAGAGFPAIPLKICFPEIKLTVVDSLNKRIGFLEHVVKELGLEDVSMYHDRAETFAHRPEFRQQFDLVMARAVARLSVLSELCLPLVKKGGHFLGMKGANLPEEVKEGEKAVKLLGGKIEDVHSFLLPIEESERNIVIIEKVNETPKKFPRKPGTPNKSPIQ